jgi:hypothetical protein
MPVIADVLGSNPAEQKHAAHGKPAMNTWTSVIAGCQGLGPGPKSVRVGKAK